LRVAHLLQVLDATDWRVSVVDVMNGGLRRRDDSDPDDELVLVYETGGSSTENLFDMHKYRGVALDLVRCGFEAMVTQAFMLARTGQDVAMQRVADTLQREHEDRSNYEKAHPTRRRRRRPRFSNGRCHKGGPRKK